MNRLLREYEGEKVDVLINNETELLLLISSRHVKYEKTVAGNVLNNKNLKTNSPGLRPSDVVEMVNTWINLYSTDIKEIIRYYDRYEVHIHPHCLVYTGTFNISIIK